MLTWSSSFNHQSAPGLYISRVWQLLVLLFQSPVCPWTVHQQGMADAALGQSELTRQMLATMDILPPLPGLEVAASTQQVWPPKKMGLVPQLLLPRG